MPDAVFGPGERAPWGRLVYRACAVVGFLVVGGCAGFDHPGSGPFEEESARDVFFTSYENIAEYYIDDVELADVTLRGLQGLKTLDPGIVVTRRGDALSIGTASRAFATLPTPLNDDPASWAALTAHAVGAWADNTGLLATTDSESVYDAVFEGILQGMDGYSRYATREEAEQLRASREGFGGIGVTVEFEEEAAVVGSVLSGSPADRSGVRTGDVIVAVDGIGVTGLAPQRVIHLLRGTLGSTVQVTLRRAEREVDFVIRRDHIVPPTVAYHRMGSVALFRITGFNQETTATLDRLVAQARAEMGARLSGIVLDMRGNPGGLLDQSVSVANLFLEDGEITATRGRHPNSNQRFDASVRDIASHVPMVVLIDGGTASAAEVVAAALKDRGRALLLGSTSYGKGSVQTVVRLPNDGEMTLTWARLVSPSGRPWSEVGVTPNVCTSTYEGSSEAFLRDLQAGRIHLLGSEGRRSLCPALEGAHEERDLEIASHMLSEPALRAIAIRQMAALHPPATH